MGDLKSYVLSLDRTALKANLCITPVGGGVRKAVEAQGGELAVTLNGQKVSLKHRTHFFFDLRDQHAAAQ